MKLKTKPRDQADSMFVKFQEIGDSVEGEFVEYNEGVPSRYGEEDNLILRADSGPKQIRCTKKLKQIVEDNRELFVPGAWVKITYSADIPTDKGNPMKDYEVDVEPHRPGKKGSAPVRATTVPDEDIPF